MWRMFRMIRLKIVEQVVSVCAQVSVYREIKRVQGKMKRNKNVKN